jgi:hypothetical protein
MTCMVEQDSKKFIFEKTNQNTFVELWLWTFHNRGLANQSFFCLYFVHKKEVLTF